MQCLVLELVYHCLPNLGHLFLGNRVHKETIAMYLYSVYPTRTQSEMYRMNPVVQGPTPPRAPRARCSRTNPATRTQSALFKDQPRHAHPERVVQGPTPPRPSRAPCSKMNPATRIQSALFKDELRHAHPETNPPPPHAHSERVVQERTPPRSGCALWPPTTTYLIN